MFRFVRCHLWVNVLCGPILVTNWEEGVISWVWDGGGGERTCSQLANRVQMKILKTTKKKEGGGTGEGVGRETREKRK